MLIGFIVPGVAPRHTSHQHRGRLFSDRPAAAGASDIDVAFGKCRLKRYRLPGRVNEINSTIGLTRGKKMSLLTCKIKVLTVCPSTLVLRMDNSGFFLKLDLRSSIHLCALGIVVAGKVSDIYGKQDRFDNRKEL